MRDSASITLRNAAPADAPAIARIHVQTWRSAYLGIIPATVLESLSIERRNQSWEKYLHENPHGALVVERAGVVVGWISFGPCRDEGDGEARQAEIYALYIDVAYQRAGLGRALMTAAERALTDLLLAATRLSLWVLARNEPTRRFYERLGYTPGPLEKQERIGGAMFTELRYEKPTCNAPDFEVFSPDS
jgi:ribosomal protein S18 acetylase RimI-like enzyme